MNRLPCRQRPLLEPWTVWEELPETLREHAIEVLTALCLEIVASPNLQPENDDSSDR
jgi:hypothetical protein